MEPMTFRVNILSACRGRYRDPSSFFLVEQICENLRLRVERRWEFQGKTIFCSVQEPPLSCGWTERNREARSYVCSTPWLRTPLLPSLLPRSISSDLCQGAQGSIRSVQCQVQSKPRKWLKPVADFATERPGRFSINGLWIMSSQVAWNLPNLMPVSIFYIQSQILVKMKCKDLSCLFHSFWGIRLENWYFVTIGSKKHSLFTEGSDWRQTASSDINYLGNSWAKLSKVFVYYKLKGAEVAPT